MSGQNKNMLFRDWLENMLLHILIGYQPAADAVSAPKTLILGLRVKRFCDSTSSIHFSTLRKPFSRIVGLSAPTPPPPSLSSPLHLAF